MLVQQGDARTNQVDQYLASILAAVAGALNVAAFNAVGFFSANMTGNVSLLSDHIARSHIVTGIFFLFILLAFIGGSAISTLIISGGVRRNVISIYAVNILAESLLLALLGVIVLFLGDKAKAHTLILGLSFLMGFQNAVVTRISHARVRTTHISGIATDIGIELGHLFDIARGAGASDTREESKSKLVLHIWTILSFLVGGIIGALFYQLIGISVLFIASVVLFVISLHSIAKAV
ncbi:MAG: hypothetical protein JWO78_1756 [Micavibrio sp.]|nr:hypothetical protein [Micavibrio sp.]